MPIIRINVKLEPIQQLCGSSWDADMIMTQSLFSHPLLTYVHYFDIEDRSSLIRLASFEVKVLPYIPNYYLLSLEVWACLNEMRFARCNH